MPNKPVILLVGAARHSTNLVANILNFDNEYQDSVEPFRLRGEANMFSFARWKYIPSYHHDAELSKITARILSGQLANPGSEPPLQNNAGFLVQELRAHLWLGWLHSNFPDVRIVLLFRHPLAVISSRVTFEWRSYLSQTLSQADLLADHLERFKPMIQGPRSALERHAIMWCIQHYVPLKQFTRGEIHLAFFENLIAQPELEVRRLFTFVGRTFDSHMASATREFLDDKRIGVAVSQAWQKHLSSADLDRSNAILRLFGLDAIYGDRKIGSVSAAEGLMRN